MYADEELDEDELREVGQHLAQCRACNQAFAKQGAMDMLLKNHYSPEPPEGFADTFWPSVAERLDGDSGSDGAGRGDEEVVFRTSPAMQILDIPERRPKETTSLPAEPAEEGPPPASPWRWPVALIMSTAIAVVGFLYYKKTSQQQTQVVAQAPAASAEPADPAAGGTSEDQLGAASQPAAAADGDGGVAVAALTPGSDAGSGGATAEPGTEPGAAPAAKGRSRRHRGRKRGRGAKKAGGGDEPAAAAAPKATAKATAKAKAQPKAGGGGSLDSLLDDAIGGAPAPKASTKPKAAATPASNLPEQLNMNQIRAAMNKIKGRVQSCYDQHQVEGMAKVRFKISPDGKVLTPSIRGKFRGTDTGDCVIKAVKRASFPKFSGKPMTISSYPFLLQ